MYLQWNMNITRIFQSAFFDVLCRIVLAVLFTHFVYRYTLAYLTSHNLLVLLYVVMESVVVVYVLTRTVPHSRTHNPYAILVALAGTFLPLMLQVSGYALAPRVAAWLMGIGVVAAIASYLSLNTSFGITPAHRSIKVTGMYALVRHPIYLSYIPIHVGYLLGYFSMVNLGLLAGVWVLMVYRIRFEEQWLMQDQEYRAYMHRVQYRLIPFVY